MTAGAEASPPHKARLWFGRTQRWGIVLGSLVVMTVGARWSELHQPLWLDEVASMRIVDAGSAAHVLRLVSLNESTPPLWYLIAFGIRRLDIALGLGHIVDLLRTVSLLESCCLTLATTVFARRFLPLAQATLAGGFVALGSLLVEHGVELRAYPLLAMLSMLFLLVLARAARRPTPVAIMSLVVVAIAGGLTHYFFLFTMAAGFIWLWTTPVAAVARRLCSTALVAGVVPYAYWVPHLRQQIDAHHVGFIGPFHGHDLVTVWSEFYFQYVKLGNWQGDVSLAVVVLVAIGTYRLFGDSRSRLCALAIVVPFGASAILWAFGQEIFDPRNLIGVAPAAAIAIAASFSLLPRRAVAVAVLAGLVLVSAAFAATEAPLKRTRYDRIAAWIEAHGWERRDPIVFFGDRFWDMNPIAWYLPGHPRLVRARSTGAGGCRTVFVVAETRAGLRWLNARDAVAETEMSWYGNLPEARRQRLPVEIARIVASPETLPEARSVGASLFSPAQSRVACLPR